MENVTRVRLVQFQRNTDEPMGITLKLNEEGRMGTCFTFIIPPQGGVFKCFFSVIFDTELRQEKEALHLIT